ncbi:MAG: ATP-binding protein [Anaerolineales bacterium]
MSEPSAPLRLLVCAPQITAAALDRAAAALSAAEAQGQAIAIEWLRPPSYARLVERLAGSPNIDMVCVVAPLADGLVPWPDGAAPLTALAQAAAAVPLTVLVASDDSAAPELPAGSAPWLGLSGQATPTQVQETLLVLFSELLAGEPIAAAAESARQALAQEEWMRWSAQPGQTLRPTFTAESGVARVVPFPESGLLPSWRRLPEQPLAGGLPESADAPFVGRGGERAALEAALLAEGQHPVCLYGPPGRGKTALASWMARWLVRTGAVARVVYTSLSGGLLSDVLVHDLAEQLLGPNANLADGETAAQVTTVLGEAPTLLIWDNLEAAFSPDALAYNDQARARLLALARELAHVPGCRLLCLCDSANYPPELAALEATSLALPELPLDQAAALVAAYTGDLGGSASEAGAIERLFELLGGNALALRCASARLKSATIDSLAADAERLLPGAAGGAARQSEQSVALGLELLLTELSPDERLAVHALGLWAQGFLEPMTLRAVELDEAVWARLKPTLLAAGALAEQRLEGLNIPRIALHPALADHLARHVPPRQRQALAPRYLQTTLGLLTWLPRGEQQLPGLTRRLLRLELANLATAVDLALAAEELSSAAELAQLAAAQLDRLALSETAAALRAKIDRAAAAAVPPEGPLSRPAVQFILRQAELLLQSGHGEQGLALLQGLVERLGHENGQSYPAPEATFDQGLALQMLASVLRLSPRPEMAVAALRQAIHLFSQAHRLPEARAAEAECWRELAEMLLAARQADAAEEAAQRGLDLAQSMGNRELVGLFQSQLGAAAVGHGQPDVALKHLQEATVSLQEAQAWAALCGVWAQVAAVQEAARSDLPAASEALSRAIAVATAANLPLQRAQYLGQRARLQARLGQLELARADLLAAAEVYRQQEQPALLLTTLRTLAELALGQHQFEEAERYAEEARQAGEAVGGGNAPWEVYALLQRIAEARGDADGVAAWRRRTQQTFSRSPAAAAVIKQWFGLIRAVAESCRGSSLSAQVAELVEKIETDEQGRPLADAIWAVLGGARGPETYRDLDHVSALIVRTILHGIEHPEIFERPAAQAEEDGGRTPSRGAPTTGV